MMISSPSLAYFDPLVFSPHPHPLIRLHFVHGGAQLDGKGGELGEGGEKETKNIIYPFV